MIVVIAILAAITIVAYTGIQQRAKESALASTLQQTVTWLATQKADTGGVSYPSDLTGLSQNSAYSYEYITEGEGYCVSVSDGQASSYVVSRATGVKLSGPCPIGHWSLENDLNDSGLYGVNGTAVGAPTLTANQRGEANAAYTISSGNYINLTNDVWETPFSADHPNAFSVSAWIRPSGYASGEAMPVVAQAYSTSMYVGLKSDGRLQLRMDDSDKNASASTAIPLNEWHHVIVTYQTANSREVVYYLDGEYDGTHVNSDGTTSPDDNLYIGRQNRSGAGSDMEFKGAISDVRIFNKVLSADEARYLYEVTK